MTSSQKRILGMTTVVVVIAAAAVVISTLPGLTSRLGYWGTA